MIAEGSLEVGRSCALLGVSRSGFYRWRRGGESERVRSDRRLLAQIREVHAAGRGAYGAPRVHAALRRQGVEVGHNRVARLMAEANLRAAGRRARRPRTTVGGEAGVENLKPERACKPDQVWVADITYLPVGDRWAYLAAVMDLHTRRIVGWSVADHMRTELVLAALKEAVASREPQPGLIHHSDRGVQYASANYQDALAQFGAVQSMSRKGNCYDNAAMESFFKTLKAELLQGMTFESVGEARRLLFEYVEVFYNRKRLHSSLGYRSPEEFESAA